MANIRRRSMMLMEGHSKKGRGLGTLRDAVHVGRGAPEHADARHPAAWLLGMRREGPRRRRAAEQRDELAPLYPNHVIPRAYIVWVRLKRTLAALAYFAQCLGCHPLAASGGRRDEPTGHSVCR